MTSLHTRVAGPSDVPRLVDMNRAAYPELVADGVVFDQAQLAAHQAVFPEGQIVVCDEDGSVVGAIATLIVPGGRALAPHTWIDITSHGTFASHTPSGDTLYLADVYSDPFAKKRGVGAALYDALFTLCRKKRLARVAAGGRLYGYHDVAKDLSIADYVAQVKRGTRRDRVLSSQLRAGFVVRGILPSYLDDWRSGNHATHLVWQNPDIAVTPHSTQQSTSPSTDLLHSAKDRRAP